MNDRIVLGSFLQPGDVVIVCESRDEYAPKPPYPVGTELTCLGFTQYFREVHYGDLSESQPKRGVYLRYGAPIFRGPEGRIDTVSCHDLTFKDLSPEDREARRGSYFWKMDHEGMFFSDLPKYEYEIGDKVQFVDDGRRDLSNLAYGIVERHEDPFENGDRAYSIALYWRDPDDQSKILKSGSYPFTRECDLILIERGNLYKHDHGEELSFESLREKAGFYAMLGKRVQLRQPGGNYGWTKDAALESIKNGYGCVLYVGPGMFGAALAPTVWAFPELPELEAELRAATLEGFGL